MARPRLLICCRSVSNQITKNDGETKSKGSDPNLAKSLCSKNRMTCSLQNWANWKKKNSAELLFRWRDYRKKRQLSATFSLWIIFSVRRKKLLKSVYKDPLIPIIYFQNHFDRLNYLTFSTHLYTSFLSLLAISVFV